MITFEDFLAAGYKKYSVSCISYADKFCQKTIRAEQADGNWKNLYFINIYLYTGKYPDAITAEVVFYTYNKWFTVSLNEVQKSTIYETELFFAKLYCQMDCVPDRDNNDQEDQMKPINFPNRRAQRKADAEERRAIRAIRSTKSQLAHLDKLLGPGQGAVKERERLSKLLEK